MGNGQPHFPPPLRAVGRTFVRLLINTVDFSQETTTNPDTDCTIDQQTYERDLASPASRANRGIDLDAESSLRPISGLVHVTKIDSVIRLHLKFIGRHAVYPGALAEPCPIAQGPPLSRS